MRQFHTRMDANGAADLPVVVHYTVQHYTGKLLPTVIVHYAEELPACGCKGAQVILTPEQIRHLEERIGSVVS